MAAPTFGLDIGRSFIKVVQVKVSGSKKVLWAAGSVKTPNGGIETESPVDLEKVAEAVKAARSSAKVNSRHCMVSIIESQVVTRMIQMPALTDKELSAAIHWEAEQYIPLPLKDVNLQYKVILRPDKSTSGKMDVLLIAAPKRVISKYLNIVKMAGLEIGALETESAALSRALSTPTDPPTIIVSMGAVSTEMVIALSGNVLFTRSIATGGVSLTRTIMAEFNLPANQAEEYKQTYGILEDKLSGKVAAILKPILDILTAEILKAVQFARTHIQQSQIVRIVICGGGAYLPGLSAFLAERTSLEVSLGDPWEKFAKEDLILKLPGQGSFYAVATGLALRS
ncbi:type IV pilus assembly protein PilM [Candidatus Curtissbacteria bacterium]|nr:type IV pilus assembly protein PilM [Candidatus Curtissbacteria bacterium]